MEALLIRKLFDDHNMQTNESLGIYREWGKDYLLKSLKTSEKNGISTANATELEIRENVYGHNKPPIKKGKSIWSLMCDELKDKILIILMISALASLVIGIWKDGIKRGWIEGITIWVAVIIVVTVSAGNNYAKEKQFRELMKQRKERSITISRDGQIQLLSIHSLLVGDIIHIRTGDCLPVDAILLSGANIRADESTQTGEAESKLKVPLGNRTNINISPFLISGTSIVEGKGIAVVVNVGERTRLGQLRAMVEEKEEEPTPLQLKLEVIADLIGLFGVWAAVITMLVLTVNLAIKDSATGDDFFTMKTLRYVLSYVILAITIIVVAVPEGLPLAVTIALAYSVHKMKTQNNLVRKLQSCETMGGANTICSDKTGTLTYNNMSVVAAWIGSHKFGEEQIKNLGEISTETLGTLCKGICVNTTAFLLPPTSENPGGLKIGNATECALLKMCEELGYDYKEYRDTEILMIPFSSERKRMTSIVNMENTDTVRVFCKGASELILERCDTYLNEKGVPVPLPPNVRLEIQKDVIQELGQEGIRTITLAYKDIPSNEFDLEYFENRSRERLEEVENNLTFIGVVGIMDPIRSDVFDAVRQCENSGITVRMITGDNMETAKAIARRAGILTDESKRFSCMEGFEFRQMCGGLKKIRPGEENEMDLIKMNIFRMICSELRVLARSSPEDKYLLVSGLKCDGNIVAVTGDGTNDAPALKKANVGFAMGKSGTEVAKEAADIILLDDNFSSIVTACKWGRNVYGSIRKFLQFQLTVNVVAIFMVLLGGALDGRSPLNPVQMLWVNLIMDTFASLALATEPPSDTLLQDPPYSKTEFIISPAMIRNILCQSLFQIAFLSILLFGGPHLLSAPLNWVGIKANFKLWNTGPEHLTIFFNTFVFMQIFNELNARKLKSEEINVFAGIFNNYLFLMIEGITIVVQLFLVQYGGIYFKCIPLNLYQHIFCVVIGVLSIPFGILFKLIPETWFKIATKTEYYPETEASSIMEWPLITEEDNSSDIEIVEA